MKVGLNFNYCNILNQRNLSAKKSVSFGEFDGDCDCTNRMSKNEYNAAKMQINDKYDKKRSSLLNDADDLEFSSSEVWRQLEQIERLRYSELRNLEFYYNY